MKSKRKLESKSQPKKQIKQKEKIGLNQKEKSKFRSTPEWKQFRVDKIVETDGKCECCGRKFKSPKLHIHHMDLDSTKYTDISDPTRFKVLCNACHDTLHWAHTLTISKKNPTSNQNIINLQAPFFI